MKQIAPVVLFLSVAACGKGGGPAPVAPTPTATQLTLSQVRDLLFIGQTQAFVVTAAFSDGSSRAVAATWSSDAPTVATVAGTGQVQGVASGEATVIADFEGQRATQRLRVLPEYAGRWEGGWREVACESTEDWRGLCDDPDPTAVWFVGFDLMQDRDAVTGRIAPYSDATFSTSGAVAIDGALSQQGTFSFQEAGVTFDIELFDWITRSTTNQTMSGTFQMRYSSPEFRGGMRLTLELVGADKIGVVPSGLRRGDAAGQRRPLRAPRPTRWPAVSQ